MPSVQYFPRRKIKVPIIGKILSNVSAGRYYTKEKPEV